VFDLVVFLAFVGMVLAPAIVAATVNLDAPDPGPDDGEEE